MGSTPQLSSRSGWRERRIFEARQLADESATLQDHCGRVGISRERVRQIEARAVQKVQRAVQIAIARRQLSYAVH
jgi:RNA polymerase sigma-32 factor